MSAGNKSIYIPLFWKFAIISTTVVILFGAINILFLWNSVYQTFDKEINKRCEVLANIISQDAVTPIVYDNPLQLRNILDNFVTSDSTISYIFILNEEGELIAQTHDLSIPRKLLGMNKLKEGQYNIEVIRASNYKHKIIRDIAYPILDGNVGVLRIGFSEDEVYGDLKSASLKMIIMIAGFLLLGLIGAFVFSFIITSPIKSISTQAQSINLENFEEGSDAFILDDQFSLRRLAIGDEMSVLKKKFSEMVSRLRKSFIHQKETQKALIQSEKMAAVGTLTAGVAHEINNPIAGIKNCTKRILKHPESHERNLEYVQMIEEANSRIETVVKHLLSFSRKSEISLGKIHINKIVKNAIELTKFKYGKKNISITTELKANPLVNGSEIHLEQVIINFILNAVDAIEERRRIDSSLLGQIKIIVSSQDEMALIEVIDNGIGIPEEIQEQIFDPFFTNKDIGKGTGLGLSVSFNLIDEHQGKIHFQSKEGQGTAFTIELPLFN